MAVFRLCFTLALLGLSPEAVAQRAGVISGIVYDHTASGELGPLTPLPGAVVSVEGGPSATTDETGRYHLVIFDPGAYNVSARHVIGSQHFLDVLVSSNTTTRLDFSLYMHSDQISVYWEPPIPITAPFTSLFWYGHLDMTGISIRR